MSASGTVFVYFLLAVFGKGLGDPCFQDWELFEESCYGFGEAQVTWGDAAEMCRASGARLAEITTAAENDFLKEHAADKGGSYYWLGGTDIYHEGSWIWMSKEEAISEFTDWYPGEPNDLRDHEDCLVLDKGYGYTWDDVNCVEEHNFICEMAAAEPLVG